MAYTIRPAIASDIPVIAKLGWTVNKDDPVSQIPWASTSEGLIDYTRGLESHFQQPQYHFLVALEGENIIGYLFWSQPGYRKVRPNLERMNHKFLERMCEMDYAAREKVGVDISKQNWYIQIHRRSIFEAF